VALIVSGLLLDNTAQWRLHLLTGLWLLSLLPRAYMDRGASPASPTALRGLARLALVLVLGFSAVGLQLARQQLTQAEQVRERALAVLYPTPVPPPDPTPLPPRPADRTRLGATLPQPIEIEEARRGAVYDNTANPLALTPPDEPRRYLNPNLGHIVGFDSRLYGASGIEARYESYLSGEQALDAAEMLRSRLLGTTVERTAADLYLTLDSRLQDAAQTALGERRGAVVLLDPRSGAILALASFPRFDPNRLVLPSPASEADVAAVRAAWAELTSRSDSPLLNRATQGRYPPGSIIKTLTAAAALDSGIFEFPESRITCPNRLPTEQGAPPVRNAVENLASLTGNPSDLRRVYAWSCNTAFAQIGLLLGPDLFIDYADRFGLGFDLGAKEAPALRDIPAEAGTIANDAAFLQRPAALADTAFGQGQILVSPLDMAQMVAIIANDGRMMRPYLVQEARAGTSVLYRARPETIRQAISPQTAQRMRSIMQTSVETGYAAPAALPGVNVGGKTGTAEVPGGAPHAWFVAIAPVEQPRFAIAVIVENGGEGSSTALPVARQVLRAALQ
jgi:peptidoglycan glycosyltransferase